MKKHLLCIVAIGLLLAAACKKKDPDPNPNTTTTSGTTTSTTSTSTTGGFNMNTLCMFSATIGGTPVSYTEDGTNLEIMLGSSGSVNPPNPTYKSYDCSLYNNSTSQNIFSIEKGTLVFSGSPTADSATFSPFFPLGSYAYSVGAANGIEISYWDASGTQWSTGLGAGTQTGSTFNVIDKKSAMVLGYFDVKIKATFNCTLYDGSGNTKTVTGGTMIVQFESM